MDVRHSVGGRTFRQNLSSLNLPSPNLSSLNLSSLFTIKKRMHIWARTIRTWFVVI
uniref:Uncharacterized protein n=1 Tax=Meloidogyne enterolobii TaxID=390850 RepID=A0A6V7X6Z6_MELEN|nr:unnamed protein product [Meloidogyne enterolobii]